MLYKLLVDIRNLIVITTNENKKEETYKMLIKIIEDYNVKLLSTKVYWDNAEERESYKKFWNEYGKLKDSDKKEILSLKRELSQISNDGEKNKSLRKFYKSKLVEFGEMRKFKNSFVTGNKARYVKVKEKVI